MLLQGSRALFEFTLVIKEMKCFLDDVFVDDCYYDHVRCAKMDTDLCVGNPIATFCECLWRHKETPAPSSILKFNGYFDCSC